MKIALFYFSGTGNTELTVKKWKSSAEQFGVQLDLFKIEKDEFDFSKITEYDKIGFGYPIHAFNAPENVWRYAKKFPKLDKPMNIFIVMVSGEYMSINHSSGKKLLRILKRRNYFLESDYHYIMPYNMIFRHTEARALRMFVTMNELVPINVEDYLVNGKPHLTKKHHLVGWFIWLLRIEQWFSGVNGKIYRVNKKKCIKCMKCINNCPTNNIEFINGKFKFHNRCLCCVRCSFNCPTDAFSIGLLNNWRVNKPYAFKPLDIKEKDRHPRYCKRSYIRYYKEADLVISNYKKTHTNQAS